MRPIGKTIVWIFALSLAAVLPAARSPMAAETKTSKERLSNKAADEQRVDNCRVPLDQRGAIPRPDCGGNAETSRSVTPGEARDNGAKQTRP
jgi:hypothetical protein